MSETALANRVDTKVVNALALNDAAGGLKFENAGQAMELAELMAVGGVAVPRHLRGSPGACLAVVIQSIEWRISPFALANKSYSVNDRLAYESSVFQAVIQSRSPIKGRIKTSYEGTGDARTCKVWAETKEGEIAEYTSPPFGKIQPKNSPLWKNDPDQQLHYFSVRSWCRRHFPDVIMGVYSEDEIQVEQINGIPTPAAVPSVAAAYDVIDGEIEPNKAAPETGPGPAQDTGTAKANVTGPTPTQSESSSAVPPNPSFPSHEAPAVAASPAAAARGRGKKPAVQEQVPAEPVQEIAGQASSAAPVPEEPPHKLTREEAREKAKALVSAMSPNDVFAFIMECAGSGDAKVHDSWVKARTLQKIGTRGVADLLAGEKTALAISLWYYRLLDQ